jgi:alginate O-acetyltransferase complex protein AlgI
MMVFFSENFNSPYITKNISEFWRRWHITLGSWMRDYLYIPLGGNRVSTFRIYLNLWLVFLISGLWHGASWNFVIWGAFHGVFLIFDRLFLISLLTKIVAWPSRIFTFSVVIIGWVFFRIETFDGAITLIKKMFEFDALSDDFSTIPMFKLTVVFAILFSVFSGFSKGKQAEVYVYDGVYLKNIKSTLLVILLALIALCLSVSFISASNFNPFIYFRF